jgi:hypothetical protein
MRLDAFSPRPHTSDVSSATILGSLFAIGAISGSIYLARIEHTTPALEVSKQPEDRAASPAAILVSLALALGSCAYLLGRMTAGL